LLRKLPEEQIRVGTLVVVHLRIALPESNQPIMKKIHLVEGRAVCICKWESKEYVYSADAIHDWSMHYQLECPKRVLYCDGRINNVPVNRRKNNGEQS